MGKEWHKQGDPHSRFVMDRHAKGILTCGNASVAYVPQIMKTMGSLASTLYLPASRNAILGSGSGSDYGLPLGRTFVEKWDQMQAGDNKAEQALTDRVTQEMERILGINALHIQASADKKALQIKIAGRRYRLDEVGSGISHLMVTLVIAAIEQRDYILIDEPEMGLHPSLQVEFLLSLGKLAKKGVVFSTHNIGLARGVADEIVSVHRHGDDHSSVEAFVHEAMPIERVGELQFGLYKDLNYTTTVLVEGPSDVRFFKEWLRVLRLDRRTALMWMDGSNVIKGNLESLKDLRRACAGCVVAIVDSDRAEYGGPAVPKQEAFAKACTGMGIPCLVTERRATEHYLSDRAVQEEFGVGKRGLTPYEELGANKYFWGKPQSWRAAGRMSREEILSTDVGKFLADHCKSNI